MSTQPQAALRGFTEADWLAYAGAESHNPQIAEWEDGTTLILDGTSIQIFTLNEDCEMTGFYSTACESDRTAEWMAGKLVADINTGGGPRQTALKAGMRDNLGPARALEGKEQA